MTLEYTPGCIIQLEMDGKPLYKIGEVAKESRISIDTIRYYEKEGLIQKAIRSEGGFRLYSREAMARLSFIRKAQSFGLTLNEIRQIMQESRRGLQPCCQYVSRLLKGKLDELERSIAELQTMRGSLKNLMSSWIPPGDAKKQNYVVCPQIERAPLQKGGKNNGKKNR